MEDLSLHVLDVAENSVRSGATEIRIEIAEDEEEDLLTLRILDDGSGMDQATIERALDPFFTTKDNKRVGLGLSLLSQAAEETGGRLTVESSEGKGTQITAVFHGAHPDMKPLGEMMETMSVLAAGNSGARFVYDYRKGARKVHFDSHDS